MLRAVPGQASKCCLQVLMLLPPGWAAVCSRTRLERGNAGRCVRWCEANYYPQEQAGGNVSAPARARRLHHCRLTSSSFPLRKRSGSRGEAGNELLVNMGKGDQRLEQVSAAVHMSAGAASAWGSHSPWSEMGHNWLHQDNPVIFGRQN